MKTHTAERNAAPVIPRQMSRFRKRLFPNKNCISLFFGFYGLDCGKTKNLLIYFTM